MQAQFDNNGVPVILGTSNADGSTPIRIKASASTHALLTVDGTTGSNLSDNISDCDDNGVTVLMATSTDGVTPVALYVDPATGELLIKST